MRKEASSIKDVLASVILKMSGGGKQKIERIRGAWKEVLDKNALAHAQPAAFKTKRLIINVDSSAWMYELSLQKQKTLAELNKKLSKDDIVISEIIFRIGDIQ